MRSVKKIIAGLIGFDRRERRGTYLLAVILIAVLVIRITSFRPGDLTADSEALLSAPVLNTEKEVAHETVPELFFFDPNTVSYDDLLRLGLTVRQANTLINFRTSGARFRRSEDLTRVYGIDSTTAERLIPYVSIEEHDAPVQSRERKEYTEVSVAEDKIITAANPIDINMCSAEELVSLPGIGEVLSARIIKYRTLLGGFIDSRQLGEVYGLDSITINIITPMVTLTFDSVVPLVLDSITFNKLARHPYVGYETARLITRYRSLVKEPLTLGNMVGSGVIDSRMAERIAPYVRPSPLASGEDYEFILSKVLK